MNFGSKTTLQIHYNKHPLFKVDGYNVSYSLQTGVPETLFSSLLYDKSLVLLFFCFSSTPLSILLSIMFDLMDVVLSIVNDISSDEIIHFKDIYSIKILP